MRYLTSGRICGCTFKNGTLTVGYLNILPATGILLVSLMNVNKSIQFHEIGAKISTYGINEPNIDLTKLIFAAVFWILIHMLLVTGAHKGLKWLLLPWIILHFVLIIAVSIFLFHPLTYGRNNSHDVGFEIVLKLLLLAFQLFLLVVVAGHYNELEGGDKTVSRQNLQEEDPVILI